MIAFLLFMWGATVLGRVSDAETREPVAGCNVYLEGTELGDASDGSGNYRIQSVSEGSYTLVFSMIGYKEERRSVSVPEAEKNIFQDAKLEKEAVSLPEVEVTSQRDRFENEVTSSAFTIDKEILRISPAVLDRDIFRTLMTLPGVTFTSDFSAALYVRGGSPDQNLVLLDNSLLYNPFHLGGFFSTFMIDAVERVDFLTGGFPASYGNRLSAVLDVESSAPQPPGGYIATSLLATEGGIWGKKGAFSGLVTARRTYFDKVIPVFTRFDFPYYFADIHATGGWRVSDKTEIDATLFYTDDKLDLAEQSIPIDFGWGNRLASLRLTQQLAEPWLLKTSLGWSRYIADANFSDALSFFNRIDDYTVRTELIRPTEESTFETGLEAYYQRFIYQVDADPFAEYNIDGRPVSGSVYASWRYKPTPLFLFQVGARFSAYYAFYPDTLKDTASGEVINIDTLISLEYEPEIRASAKYFLDADNAVNISIGNFYQNIAMVLPEGGRIPTNFWIPLFGRYEPQQAYHFILGYEYLSQKGYRIKLEPYYKHYPNLLVFNETFDIADADEDLFSSGKGRSYGVDLSLEKMKGNLTGWISYSLGFSRFISDTLEFYTNFDRRHNVSVIGSYAFSNNWRVNANFTFATGMPYAGTLGRYRVWYWDPIYQDWRYQWYTIEADRNSLRFPPYHRLDIGGSKTWEFKRWSLTVRVDIINVYNHKNVLLYYYDLENEPPTLEKVSMIPIFPSIGVEARF